jgi:hypothetical protein
VRENIARYINHACKPNAESDVRPRKRKVFIRAIKNIEPGEEINYDYGTDYFKSYLKPIGCKCDACEKKRRKKRAEARAERLRLKVKAERKAKKKAEKLAKARAKARSKNKLQRAKASAKPDGKRRSKLNTVRRQVNRKQPDSKLLNAEPSNAERSNGGLSNGKQSRPIGKSASRMPRHKPGPEPQISPANSGSDQLAA